MLLTLTVFFNGTRLPRSAFRDITAAPVKLETFSARQGLRHTAKQSECL